MGLGYSGTGKGTHFGCAHWSVRARNSKGNAKSETSARAKALRLPSSLSGCVAPVLKGASFAAMCGIVCSSLTPPLQRGERAHLSGFVKRTRPLRCSWHGAAQTKAIRRQCARCYLSRRRSRFCRVRFSPGLAALWLRSSSRIACAASTTRWKGRTSRSVGCDSAKGSPHRPTPLRPWSRRSIDPRRRRDSMWASLTGRQRGSAPRHGAAGRAVRTRSAADGRRRYAGHVSRSRRTAFADVS